VGSTNAVDANITLTNSGPTFATPLTNPVRNFNLTIGDGTGTESDITLPNAVLTAAGDDSVITVNKNAALILGNTTTDIAVNPAGSIKLIAGDSGKDNGGKLATLAAATGSTFARLKDLDIGNEASFSAAGTAVTFAALEIIKVGENGLLSAPNTNQATLFNTLNIKISKNTTPDVTGNGKVDLPVWVVTSGKQHAFNQLLAIKEVGILSITGLIKTSGYDVQTEDAAAPGSSDAILTIYDGTVGITLTANLTVDRNLNLASSAKLIGPVGRYQITINQGKGIYANGKPVLGGSASQTLAVLSVVGGGTLTADATDAAIVNSAAVTVLPGSKILVPGQFGGGGNIVAGDTDGALTLTADAATYLKGGSIETVGTALTTPLIGNKAIVNVDAGGILSVGAASANAAKVIDINVAVGTNGANGGTIDATGGALTIGTGIINGILKATSAGTIVSAATTANAADAVTTVTGSYTATGAAAFKGTTSKTVKLTGKIKVGKGTSEYDTAEFGDSDLYGEVVFNGNTGIITIPSAGNVKKGSLLTKGEGGLAIASIGTIYATGTAQTWAETVTIDGTNGLTTGTLTLGADTTLALTGELKVGVSTASPATLAVSSGKETLANASAKISAQAEGGTPANKGTITVGSITIVGVDSSTGTVADSFGNSSKKTTGDGTASDIFAASTGVSGANANQDKAASLVVGSGTATITGHGDGNTLSSASELYVKQGA
jgi:hypothetical protein